MVLICAATVLTRFNPKFRHLMDINQCMQSVPDNLLMTQCFSSRCCLIRKKRMRVIKKSRRLTRSIILIIKEQFKLLHDRIFGRKSEQTAEPNTPKLALFSEPESEPIPLAGMQKRKSLLQPRVVVSANHCQLNCRVSKSSTNCPNTN